MSAQSHLTDTYLTSGVWLVSTSRQPTLHAACGQQRKRQCNVSHYMYIQVHVISDWVINFIFRNSIYSPRMTTALYTVWALETVIQVQPKPYCLNQQQ